MRNELEELLKVPLDLLTFAGLNPTVLQRFKQNSILLENLPTLTDETAIKETFASQRKALLNLRSIVWVISRILDCCRGITKEELFNNVPIQDALTRNIQLLGQVVSQIPDLELENLANIDPAVLRAFVPLKEALFMNVDFALLWNTLTKELEPLKQSVERELAILEQSS